MGVSSHQARSDRSRAQSPIIGGRSRRDGAGGPETRPTGRSESVLAPYTPKKPPDPAAGPASAEQLHGPGEPDHEDEHGGVPAVLQRADGGG